MLLLGLVACGGDSDAQPADATSTAPNGDVVSAADVSFAQEMIPHHADALVMVDLTLGRDLDPRVATLMEEIRTEQSAQVQTMSGWLTAWDEQVPETARDHANAHAAEEDGQHDDALASLEEAEGPAFERALLENMVEHHQTGLDTARAQAEDGTFAPARDLAAEVVAEQEREVEEMQDLLASR